jgi:hypothetical protein
MMSHNCRLFLLGAMAAALTACGGGGTALMPAPPSGTQSGIVSLVISDASSEDWATIGVKVLSVALVPQGGGSNVTVFTAPGSAPMLNLAALDQLGEIIGNASVPVGSYTGAVLTIGGNQGDVLLVAAADPETGFAGVPGATIPADQIQIQGAQGVAPNRTVQVKVNFAAPLVVNAGQSNALDLEFDLGHPALIVGHVLPAAGVTLWAVNFNGPVRHLPVRDITRLVLRHMFGSVSAVASDKSSITITRQLPTLPAVNPQTPVATSQSQQILADATNGTIFYDVDARTHAVIRDFSSQASSIVGKYVRIAARYQQDGTLVATRVWASTQFNSVFVGPEGHVLHVDVARNIIVVASETGRPVPLAIDANTEFYFRTPGNALADATPIGTGPAFLANQNIVRGFKIHASVVDPLAVPMVAQTIDIETAVYDGRISASDSTGFTFVRRFVTTADNYTRTLTYISNTSANGRDAAGNPVTGFKWWNFAYPTLVTSGPNAINDFVSATNGGVNFGGTAGAVNAWGASYARWNDPINANGWSAPVAILVPTPLPLGTVATAFANMAFGLTVPGGTNTVTVNVGTTAGSATLVYQVDRTNGVVTISPVDVTTSAGLASLTSGLAAGTVVKTYGVPQADGTLKAYALTYFTGNRPTL